MAKKTSKKPASGKKTPLHRERGPNLERLVRKGCIDPEAANRLDDSVKAKIERRTPEEMTIIIKWNLDICGGSAEPEPDGSFF